MPMEFLRTIADQKLPCRVDAVADIDKLRVLRAADLVVAFLPPPGNLSLDDGMRPPAQVLAITPKGRRALGGQLEETGFRAM